MEVMGILRELGLHTVCEEANCPNRGECFESKTATFMILGNVCTRNCTFCAVSKGKPQPVDPDEPERLAEAASKLGLEYVVVTSVTRDDLPDGGAGHFAKVTQELHKKGIKTELLIPDFQGNEQALKTVLDSDPEVLNHNVETVPRLYPEVRPKANYLQSLELLNRARDHTTKSGIMLGLGEKQEEVEEVLDDLIKAGCDFLTIGQYLAPSRYHHPVIDYVHPDKFEELKQIALHKGFKHVASGPFVRSSYHAKEAWEN